MRNEPVIFGVGLSVFCGMLVQFFTWLPVGPLPVIIGALWARSRVTPVAKLSDEG